MGLKRLLLDALAVSLLAAASAAHPALARAAGDASGHARIVSLAPSVTETLFALGAGGEVVGVSEFDSYPPQVRKLPKVGTFLTPNVEAVAALRPTLVIGLASSANQREVHAIGAMGYPTLMVEEDSLADIERSIGVIGNRIGRGAQARGLLGRIKSHIDKVRERLDGAPKQRVLMLVGHQPLVAVGRGTFLDDLLGIAHADNIADTLGESWPRLSIEYIIATRPEVILDGQMGNDPSTPSHFWEQFPTIPAVRNHRIYGYPPDPTLNPGPRVARTLDLLAALIHPKAFPDGARNGLAEGERGR